MRWEYIAILTFSFFASNHSTFANPSPSILLENSEAKLFWIKLLHYEYGFHSGQKSAIQSPLFFIAEDGKVNPESEFQSNLQLIDSGRAYEPSKQLPYSYGCTFPARIIFFKKFFRPNFQVLPCLDFENWRSAIQGDHVSLVFSSPYAGNPASLFGHTFLKFSKHPNNQNELLDYAVNFAAFVPEKENGLRYALWGLFGGYEAGFLVAKYYEKVKEYTQAETRDLWLYDLNLTTEQQAYLIAHLWELYTLGKFQYFFTSQNCSFRLLDLLEAADPKTKYKKLWPFYVLPGETVKAVVSGPATTYRPSLVRTLDIQLRSLTPTQFQIFEKIKSNPAELNLITDPAPLESYLSYQRFKNHSHESQRPTLLKLSELKQVPDLQTERTFTDPTLGHGSYATTVGYSSKNEVILGVSALSHSLLASPLGYEKYNSIEILSPEFSISKDSLKLSRFSLLKLGSLFPYRSYWLKPSHELELSIISDLEKTCTDCHAFKTAGNIGLSFDVNSGHWIMFTYLHLGLTARSHIFWVDKLYLNFGPGLLQYFEWNSNQRSILRYEFLTSFSQSNSHFINKALPLIELGHAYSLTKNSEIQLNFGSTKRIVDLSPTKYAIARWVNYF